MSLLVLGTVAFDSVKTPSGERSKILGGSATHFCIGAHFFTSVNLVATIGDDFPEKYLNFFKKKKIILDSLVQACGKTFSWKGDYCKDLNCALTRKTELGVLLDFIPTITARQKNVKYVFLANYDPDIQKDFLEKVGSAKLVGLDTMNFWIVNRRKSLLRVLKKVNIFVANDQEARELSGEKNLIKAAKALHRFGPSMILIKKGEHGVLFYSKDLTFSMPAFPTEKVVDPTGAGDTFAGGFMGYLSKVNSLDPKCIKRAVAYGSVIASFNVEKFGTDGTSKLNRKMIEFRLHRFKQGVTF